MRLLNTESLRLELFIGSSVPDYAILSHTWGDDEVLFDDIRDPDRPLPSHKASFAKVEGGCRQARGDGYKYMWIDTCCIDKSSSAELSEAINSMFEWYHLAGRCYVYLVDVDGPPGSSDTDGEDSGGEDDREDGKGDNKSQFETSRWFTRGWTLQELIAPVDVRFYDRNWTFIGVRQLRDDDGTSRRHPDVDLGPKISQTTGIPIGLLRWWDKPRLPQVLEPRKPADKLETVLQSFSIARKMSWAARRKTTRLEDEAYSLMGLFGVNMPMLYGEGRRAFHRLQQAIMAVSSDQSILAFAHTSSTGWPDSLDACPLLADSTECFTDCLVETPGLNAPVWLSPGQRPRATVFSPSLKALEIDLCVCPVRPQFHEGGYLGILDCVYQNDYTSHPAIFLRPLDDQGETFIRVNGAALEKISPMNFGTAGTYDLNSYAELDRASWKTVRIYFHPQQLATLRSSPSGVLSETDDSAPGLLVQWETRSVNGRGSCGCYPERAQQSPEGHQFYVPSTHSKHRLKKQAQDQQAGATDANNDKFPDEVVPFGVLVLHFYGAEPFLLSWGEVRGGRGMSRPYPRPKPRLWLTVIDFSTVVKECNLRTTPRRGLDAMARAVFENQSAWVGQVDTRHDSVVEASTGLGVMLFSVDEISFFKRPILRVRMMLENAARDATLFLEQSRSCMRRVRKLQEMRHPPPGRVEVGGLVSADSPDPKPVA